VLDRLPCTMRLHALNVTWELYIRLAVYTIGCQKSVRPMRTSHHINTLISTLKKDKCTPRRPIETVGVAK
jgi:hypothetical protein